MEVERVSSLRLLLAYFYVDLDASGNFLSALHLLHDRDLVARSGQTEKYCNIFYMSHRHEKSREVCCICHYIVHGKTNTNLFALDFKYSPYTKDSP